MDGCLCQASHERCKEACRKWPQAKGARAAHGACQRSISEPTALRETCRRYCRRLLAPHQGYRWLKYEYYDKVESYGGPQSGINGQVIRYADVKLMLAEAYIQQGITSAVPLALINDVRIRAGAVPYSTLGDQTNAIKILMRERQLELCGEQSRYFDLIRWGIAKETINTLRAVEEPAQPANPFKDKNVLLPIPIEEKSANPNVAKDIKDDWN